MSFEKQQFDLHKIFLQTFIKIDFDLMNQFTNQFMLVCFIDTHESTHYKRNFAKNTWINSWIDSNWRFFKNDLTKTFTFGKIDLVTNLSPFEKNDESIDKSIQFKSFC